MRIDCTEPVPAASVEPIWDMIERLDAPVRPRSGHGKRGYRQVETETLRAGAPCFGTVLQYGVSEMWPLVPVGSRHPEVDVAELAGGAALIS